MVAADDKVTTTRSPFVQTDSGPDTRPRFRFERAGVCWLDRPQLTSAAARGGEPHRCASPELRSSRAGIAAARLLGGAAVAMRVTFGARGNAREA